MVFGWLAFFGGIGYGYFKKGKQEKGQLLKTGLVWGLIIALVLAVIGAVSGVSAVGFGTGLLGALFSAVIIVVLFVIGVWLGDVLEGKFRQPSG